MFHLSTTLVNATVAVKCGWTELQTPGSYYIVRLISSGFDILGHCVSFRFTEHV